MKNPFASFLRLCFLVVLIAGAIFQPQYPVYAAANLTVTPLTWNVIGLDSNNPASGPYRFPVGARVCNTAPGTTTATNVVVDFVWDSFNGNIDLRLGSLDPIIIASLPVGSCSDAYFEVEVDQVAAAYDTFRQYHITATDSLGVTGSTPTPRALYVEHLISQSRNAITDVRLNGVSVPAGGSMNLLVGNTYTIELYGGTATQGYNQFEAFINFPNTIFQILSVSTDYSANNSPYVSTSDSPMLYADACKWENDPNSPNYRSCVGGDFKTGGSNVVTTYTIRIISGGGTTQTLNTLLYDFSGSSYHYNADYSLGARFANIIDPTNVTIAKSFSPNPGSVNGVSALTITITNPNPGAISGYHFTDPLPNNMSVASTPGATTTSCGSPTFAPLAGANSISFSNGTIAANGTCTIKVNVTTTATGTYNNTTNNLFVDTLDTGRSATASLTVNNAPATPPDVCGLAMAQWTFPAGFSTTSPVPSSSTVTASASPGVGITSTDFTEGTDSWGSNGNVTVGATFATTNNEYVQFAVNTTGFSSVSLTFDAARKNTPNSPRGIAVYYGPTVGNPETGTSLYNNATALPLSTLAFSSFGSFAFTPSAPTMYVRIYFFNSGNDNSGSDIFVDNVTFTGCATPTPPTIAKAFLTNPIPVNGTSTLRFILSNSNSIPLTGVTFTDALPNGLQVAATPAAATTCGGIPAPTWAPGAGATSLTFGSPLGASIPAGSSCTVSVDITGTASGSYQNVSGFISSTNGGTNTGSTGSATASLSVIRPPTIAKLFSPNPILANGTSRLTFTITNPNQNDALNGLSFTDTFPLVPGAMTVAAPLTTTNSCGGTLQDSLGGALASGDPGIRLITGVPPLAGGSSCTITVNVTAPTVGSYANTSGTVASTNGGTGNKASDTLVVDPPNPAIVLLKQISTSSTGPWTSYITVDPPTSVYYQFTIENSGDVPLSPVSMNDPTISGEENCAWPNTLPVADINDDDHIATCVVGPVLSVTGTNTNTATASGTFGGTPYTSISSSATYSTPAITLVKSVTETSFDNVGDTLSYSYLVTNSGFAPLLGPVTVTDDKITLPNTVTCPAVNTVGDLDAWFDPDESLTCTSTYTVTATDMTAAMVTNTASASVSNITSNDSSVTVYRSLADLTVTKVNNVSGSVPQNGSFDWTITVTNSGIADAIFADGQTILSDPLPAGANYGLIIIGGGIFGPIDCAINSGTLTCTANGAAVILPPGASLSATFGVSPTAAGSLSNTATVDPNGNVTEIDETNNEGTNVVIVVAPPTITKSFGADPVALNGTSIITFTITNPAVNTVPLTNVSFTDIFPAGLQFVAPPNQSTTCLGGFSLTATNLPTPRVIFNLTSLPVNTSCNVTVTATATSDGTLTNSVAASSTNGGIGNTATDTLTVTPVADVAISKTDGVANVNAGGTTTYTIRVTNNGPSGASLVILGDPAVAGLTKTDIACSATPGRCSTAPTVTELESNTFTLPDLGSGQFYEITVTANVTAGSGSVTNTASVYVNSPGVIDPDTTNNTASDTDTINPIADLAITKTNGLISVDAGGTTTYTIRVTNHGPSIVTGATLSDPAVAGLSKTIVACSATPGECMTAPTVVQLEGGSFVLPDLISGAFYEITVTANVTATNGSVTNTATVTPPVGTTDPDNTNNDVSDTDTVNPAADLSITKTDGVVAVTPGGITTYTIVVTNNGPSAVTGATITDTFPVGIASASWTCVASVGSACGVVSGTGDIATTADLLVNGTVTFTVTANISAAATGNLLNTATVTPPGGTNDPTPANDSASDTNSIIDIDAVNDMGSTVNGAIGDQAFANVLTNDTLNGNPATLANVNLTQVSTTNPGVTLDVTTGAVNVAPGTPAGTYTVTYQICDQANPTICDTATVTVPVVVVDAINDSGSAVNGTAGGQSLANVLTNDTLNGNPATLANVNLTQVSTTNAGVTLDVTTGAVNVAPGTPAGNYTVTYQICDQANPTICDTATVSVPVVVMDAVDDDFSTTPVNGYTGGTAGNAFTNDTLNGVAIIPAQIVAIVTTPASHPGVTLNTTTGSADVAAGTPVGIYSIDYQICDLANPTICDSATITVVVAPPVINAVDDDFSTTPVNGYTGGNAGNAFTNDTLNGAAVVPSQITATIVTPASNPGVTMNPGTSSVDVAAGTPAGTYTIDYQICENLNPTNCDTATITVVVNPPVINAVDDDYSSMPVNGYVGGNAGNAFSNDTLNGVAVVPAQITTTILTPASDPGVTLNTATGSVDVAAGTPAGTFTIDYQICENLNPTNCDRATITVVVNPPVINAVDDDYSSTPVNGYVGGNAGNAFTNDTLNGVAVVPAQITASIVTPASNPGVTMNTSTGSVDVAASTPAGTFTIDYQICENLNPNNCDAATITVVVNPPAINAVNDFASGVDGVTGATAVLNLFNNDTLNGIVVIPAEVTLTETVPDPGGALTLNPNGSVDVAPGTLPGTYQLTYQICETLNPTNCDTAIVTVVVGTPAHTTVKTETSTGPYAVGNTITFDIVVTNTGNVTLTNVAVTDSSATVGACAPVQPSTLAPNATMTCSAGHVVTQADVNTGNYVNTATGDSDQTAPNISTVTINFSQTPSLNVVKEVSTDTLTWNNTSVTVTVGDTVYYRVRVENTGNITLTNLLVDDGMAACTLVRGTDMAGNNDADFEVGEEWTYTCSVTAVAGTNNNIATADTTETLQDSDAASYTAAAALVADPALSKAGSPTQAAVGETVTFTLTVTNAGTAPATNVVVTDPLPAMFDVVTVTSVDQFGVSVGAISVSPAPAPYTVTVNLAILNVTDIVTITITTTVNSLGNPPINNTAWLTTTGSNTIQSNDSDTVTTTLRSAPSTASNRPATLPATGFAPDVETKLPAQPQDRLYAATEVMLEIPSLGVKLPIVGVPKKNGTWDVSWLGKQAGWLEESAFPSWNGNSVLTSHVYASNGSPGPFVNLNKLKYGDQIIVHAYGQKYIFEVQTNQVVLPTDRSAFQHEENPWLTLITCKEYDEKTNTYRKRVVVRAVLVKVMWEK